MNISITLRRAAIAAALGMGFAATAFAATGNPPLATNESWSSCTESLCIDAPPQGPNGLDASGGWGFGASAPVTTLTVGKNAVLTVTALQVNPTSPGTITLTYSSYDFAFVSKGDATAVCTSPFDRGGVISCTYSDFAHTDKGDGFTFTPLHPTNTAL